MNRGRLLFLSTAFAIGLTPTIVLAGMPVPYTLRELAKLRIEAISFFLVVLLIAAGLIKWIWNGFRTPESRLPRLTYGKALGVVFLWGLLFSVVLAMISGARELMTPGAWEKQGATYRLKSQEPTK